MPHLLQSRVLAREKFASLPSSQLSVFEQQPPPCLGRWTEKSWTPRESPFGCHGAICWCWLALTPCALERGKLTSNPWHRAGIYWVSPSCLHVPPLGRFRLFRAWKQASSGHGHMPRWLTPNSCNTDLQGSSLGQLISESATPTDKYEQEQHWTPGMFQALCC